MGSWATLVAARLSKSKEFGVAPTLGRRHANGGIRQPFCAFKGGGAMVRCVESSGGGAFGSPSIRSVDVDGRSPLQL